MEQLLLKDLAQEIDMLKIQIRDLEIEHKFLMKNMAMNVPKFNGVVDYTKERVQGGEIPLDLVDIYTRHNKIAGKINVLTEMVQEKQQVMNQVKDVMASMKDLEKRIMYYRDVKGMNLKQIAVLLNYSHSHIRRVSSKMKLYDMKNMVH
ncbi:sigma factor-like helix-turn-helix DNA-binding protein [Bacillus tropicus]|uniref:sigma factor-like helix-turn-helix DNA-binding protein n=1 Tax=Bacillus tropicus TaxID=2026188 RepID=UPI000B42F2F7|nr:sigma factor-like helix-turn-helix DNA-binding protein [Bacillus tropicus]MBG9939507.1 hypothetical protein [Bacillus tropicus]MED2992950.1 sigma factor-like helix-turn-helix DNA-binding protein [Bacillus tropicus]OTY49888.1 hypothetical protein BK748_26705 [Bacillus thuringiensis serovar graciosensis]